jgi:hypothetical protein
LAAAVFVSVLVSGPGRGQAQSADDVISLQGRVVNGTAGAELPNGLAVLMLVTGTDGTLSGTGQTSPDPEGRFVFQDVKRVEGGNYTLSVDYDGVFYGTNLTLVGPEQDIILTVFEPTQDASVVSVGRHVMVLAAVDDKDRMVTAFEFAEVANLSDRTLVPDLTNQAQISFLRFALPPNASDLNVESSLRGGDIIAIPTGIALTAPVPPGDHSVVFSYSFPYEGSGLAYRQSLVQGAEVFQVLVPEGLTSVSVPGLAQIPPVNIQGTSYRAWEGRDFPPGRGLELAFTGLPEPGVWSRFGSSVTYGTFWQIAIPSAVGATLAALLLWGLVQRYRPAPAHHAGWPTTGQGSPERASLVQAVAELDERYQQGQVSEEDYRQQRQGLIARALEEASEPENTAGA